MNLFEILRTLNGLPATERMQRLIDMGVDSVLWPHILTCYDENNQLIVDSCQPVLSESLTREAVLENVTEDNRIEGIVSIGIGKIINNDLEGFLDILSEKLIGNSCLMDIGYEVVGNRGDELLVLVNGDASYVVDDEV